VITEGPARSALQFLPDPKTRKQIALPVPARGSVLTGYFMVFRTGQWLRLEAELPARVFNAG
jgi:hypothetical protein